MMIRSSYHIFNAAVGEESELLSLPSKLACLLLRAARHPWRHHNSQ